MTTVSIQEAQARLSELIHRLTPEEEVVITENDQPIAAGDRGRTGATAPNTAIGDSTRHGSVHGPGL